ncbi:hypothetical protein [Arthrobacter sp. efr-133-TYG-104]|uniref:hypothetical protein n=1 Tax=Arthrobacter sp. efr-133-TYG-104 TaxID=3040324 RepID=UPI00254B53A2|nr:hypothetical protein [Arthrobacter sp. efr-133-TYG-104]
MASDEDKGVPSSHRSRRGDARDGDDRQPPYSGASNGGFTFHDRHGGPYGRTEGAKRVEAGDATGLRGSIGRTCRATHGNRASELMLDHLSGQVVTGRLDDGLMRDERTRLRPVHREDR